MLDLEVVLTIQDILRYKWMIALTSIIGWEILKFTIKYLYRRMTKKETKEATEES